MSALMPFEASAAYDLVELAWDLACREEVGVTVGDVTTDRGSEPCVVAHVVADARPFLLVPRPGGVIELWWSEFDAAPSLVAITTTIHGVVEEARKAHSLLATIRRAERE